MLEILILSEYEASTVFDAIKRGIEHFEDIANNNLIKEIEDYHILEDRINRLASKRNSQQMVLLLHKRSADDDNDYHYDDYVGYDYQELSHGLKLSQNYLTSIRNALIRKKYKILPSISDLLNKDENIIGNFFGNGGNFHTENLNGSYNNTRMQDSTNSNLNSFSSMGNSFRAGDDKSSSGRRLTDATSHTIASMTKAVHLHRGVLPVAYDKMDLAEREQMKYEDNARDKRNRIDSSMMKSQSISPFTGSRYTKIDSNLQDSSLSNLTESRNHHIQIDSSPMTSNDKDLKFKSSLRENYYHDSHDTHSYRGNTIKSSNKSYQSNNDNNRNRIYSNYNIKSNENMRYNTSSDSFQETPVFGPMYGFSPRTGSIQTKSDQNTDQNLNQRNLNNSHNDSYQGSTKGGSSPGKNFIENNIKSFPDHLRVKMRQKMVNMSDGPHTLDGSMHKHSIHIDHQHEIEHKNSPLLGGNSKEQSPNIYHSFNDNERKIVDGNVTKLVQRYHHYFSNNKFEKSPEKETTSINYRDDDREEMGLEFSRSDDYDGYNKEEVEVEGRRLDSEYDDYHNQGLGLDSNHDVKKNGKFYSHNLASKHNRYSPRDRDVDGENLWNKSPRDDSLPLDRGPGGDSPFSSSFKGSDRSRDSPNRRYDPYGRPSSADLREEDRDYEDDYDDWQTEGFSSSDPGRRGSSNEIDQQHLKGLESGLFARTKAYEYKIAAVQRDALKPRSPRLVQPAFKPGGRGRSSSPSKWRGRTFSKGTGIVDSVKKSRSRIDERSRSKSLDRISTNIHQLSSSHIRVPNSNPILNPNNTDTNRNEYTANKYDSHEKYDDLEAYNHSKHQGRYYNIYKNQHSNEKMEKNASPDVIMEEFPSSDENVDKYPGPDVDTDKCPDKCSVLYETVDEGGKERNVQILPNKQEKSLHPSISPTSSPTEKLSNSDTNIKKTNEIVTNNDLSNDNILGMNTSNTKKSYSNEESLLRLQIRKESMECQLAAIQTAMGHFSPSPTLIQPSFKPGGMICFYLYTDVVVIFIYVRALMNIHTYAYNYLYMDIYTYIYVYIYMLSLELLYHLHLNHYNVISMPMYTCTKIHM
jgi:hypothetical protein